MACLTCYIIACYIETLGISILLTYPLSMDVSKNKKDM